MLIKSGISFYDFNETYMYFRYSTVNFTAFLAPEYSATEAM